MVELGELSLRQFRAKLVEEVDADEGGEGHDEEGLCVHCVRSCDPVMRTGMKQNGENFWLAAKLHHLRPEFSPFATAARAGLQRVEASLN